MISTTGRIFSAQLTRDLAERQILGAGMLAPGCTLWTQAIEKFLGSIKGGPRQAADQFMAGVKRLKTAQGERCCFVNGHFKRSRSAIVELLVWEVDKHPLIPGREAGVMVRAYVMRLQRRGVLSAQRTKLAFFSWHALGGIAERSKLDIFDAGGMVAMCGFAGMIMRESEKHRNTSISLASAELTAVGVLRHLESKYSFFDVLTVLPPDADKPYQLKQRHQGGIIGNVVAKYISGGDPDLDGLADNIPVIPFDHHDYVSTQLKRKEQDHGEEQALEATRPTGG
jgi:hypothetical protein